MIDRCDAPKKMNLEEKKDHYCERTPSSGSIDIRKMDAVGAANVNVAAVVRDYNVEPRIDYRTVR